MGTEEVSREVPTQRRKIGIQQRYDYVPDEEFYQSEEWQEIKQDILERDEFRCRVCGSIEDLSVHHIVPRRYKHLVEFDIDSQENLLTMCWEHHGMADRKVDKYGRSLEV